MSPESVLGQCATKSCDRDARWLTIELANKIGNSSPRFCEVCCDAISLAFAALRAAEAQRIGLRIG